MSKDRAAQLVEAGIWLKLSGDVEGAQKLFQRALKLDPDNEQARQLLAPAAAPAAPPPSAPAPVVAPPSNPFERPVVATPPSVTETAWGMATGFGASTPSSPAQVNLEDDWGRFTGASTPVPSTPAAVAPPAAPAAVVLPSSDSGLRAGAGGEGAVPRHTMVQFGGAAQSGPAPIPKHTMVQFSVDSLPSANGPGAPLVPFEPAEPPAPRHTMVEFAPTPAEPPAPRHTMVEFAPTPAEPPAPRHTMVEFAPSPAEQPAPRHTMVEFAPSPAEQPAPRHTMVEFAPSPAEQPAPRHTMVQFAPSPAEQPAPRHTMVQYPGQPPRAPLADFSLPPEAATPWGDVAPPGAAAPEMFAVAAEPLPPVADILPAAAWSAPPVAAAAEPGAVASGTPPGVQPPPADALPWVDVQAEPENWGAAAVAAPPVSSPGDGAAPISAPVAAAPAVVEARPRPPVKRSTGMWGLPAAEPSADGGWFPEAAGDSPVGWELPPAPVTAPSVPVMEAVRELEPAPEVVAVPVPPPPVFDAAPPVSAPVFTGTPPPGPATLEPSVLPPAPAMPFDLPSPEPAYAAPAAPVFGESVPPPAPSAPGVRADLSSRDALFGTPGLAPVPSPPEPAWAWSGAAAPPQVTPAEWAAPPEPRPSPSLAPAAQSAWDQRSNPGVQLPVVPGRDKALDLISSDSKISRPPEERTAELQAILKNARRLLDLDDHTGAMEFIVKAEALAPDDLEVKVLKERSERTLLTMLESKLGPLTAVPRVLLKDDEIIWLNLDHRAGFVLAQIDGSVTFDDLFSVSGMTRLDTARILAQLVDEGVISRG